MKFINFLNKNKFFLIFLFLGFLVFFWPMLASDFELMPGIGLDIKISNYILEHSFLLLKGVPLHEALYSAPFGQVENVIANFDLMLTYMPIYWVLRLCFDAFSSIQALFFIVCFLNYLTSYLLLRRIPFSRFASSFGAFVFAFNLLRCFNIENVSYFSQFLSVLALIFLLKVNKNNSKVKNNVYFILFSLFLLLQFYTCFSLGYFFVFGLVVFSLLSFLPKASRDYMIEFIKSFHRFIFYYFVGIALLLLPLIFHFVLNENFNSLSQILADIKSYLALFRNISFLDNLFLKSGYVTVYDNISLSYGIFVTIFAIVGLLKMKKNKGVCTLSFFSIIFLSCTGSAFLFYKVFYFLIPLSEYIKQIDNFIYIGLIFIAIGLASLIDLLKEKKKIVLAIVFLLTLELIPLNVDKNSSWKNYAWSKKEFVASLKEISDKIPNNVSFVGLKANKINRDIYSIIDKEIKDKKTKKIIDSKAIWLSAIRPIRVLNSYVENKQIDDNPKVYEIYVDIDYQKL